MQQASKRADAAWRKEAGPWRPRDRALARQLADDPEVSNRLIQTGSLFSRHRSSQHEFDQKLAARRN